MLHHNVEGLVADNRISFFPPACCCWRGTCQVGLRQLGGQLRGLGPELCQQPAVCCDAAVLRRRWPPSQCLDAAPCGLCLVAGGGGWCWCGAVTHAEQSVAACNLGQPSLTSASTSGLCQPVLPRRLWRVVCWVRFQLDVICGVEIVVWEGCYPALTLATTCGQVKHHDRCL